MHSDGFGNVWMTEWTYEQMRRRLALLREIVRAYQAGGKTLPARLIEEAGREFAKEMEEKLNG